MRVVRKPITKRELSVRILFCETVGFLFLVFLVWVEEILDLPHILFGAPATPINTTESLMETVVLVVFGSLILWATYSLLRRIRYLEGFLHVCAFCKKIEVGHEWVPIEQYVADHSGARFSHSFCPECAEAHYGNLLHGRLARCSSAHCTAVQDREKRS